MEDFNESSHRQLHIATPLVLHPNLSTEDRKIWLKLENLQPSGSFKIRGIGALCQEAAGEGKRSIVAPSGGNAGFAAALAARSLGLGAEIVVPTTTPKETCARIRALGAVVTVSGDVWEESNAYALKAARRSDVAYVPAFDHSTIWQGNSTLVDEIIETLPEVDGIVASVGGGGLLSGVIVGLKRHRRTDCRVVACETHGAASFDAAIKAGKPVRLDAIRSIAKSLGALEVAEWPVKAIQDFPYRTVVLSDAQAVSGVLRFADDFRLLVEPACGVSLACAYLEHQAIAGLKNVVVVVCGGLSISPELISEWRSQPDGFDI